MVKSGRRQQDLLEHESHHYETDPSAKLDDYDSVQDCSGWKIYVYVFKNRASQIDEIRGCSTLSA